MSKRNRFLTAMLSILLVISVIALIKALTYSPPQLPQVTLITTRTAFSAAVLLAHQRGWFQQAGVEVSILDRPSGKEALAELMDGKADYATASETPIMFALLKSQSFRVISGLNVGIDTITIIARRDHGIKSSDHLQGKRIGFVPGTTSHYFLDIFLEYRGIKADAVIRIPLKAEELVPALLDGQVDAISAWTPYNHQAQMALGTNSVEFQVGAIHRWGWNLVARNETVARQATSEYVLSALMRASEAIKHDPVTCAHELAESLNLSPEEILKIWKLTQFEINLDQSLLLTLEMQARWAISNGLTDQREVPNFLPAFSSQALRALDPDMVTLIDVSVHP